MKNVKQKMARIILYSGTGFCNSLSTELNSLEKYCKLRSIRLSSSKLIWRDVTKYLDVKRNTSIKTIKRYLIHTNYS